MPKRELPHKCHNCRNTLLVDFGVAGQWDSIISDGSPGTTPNIMGTRWAVYYCTSCGFVGPWAKQYAASANLAKEYKEFLTFCKGVYSKRQIPSTLDEKLKSLMDAQNILEGFPNPNQNNFDEALSNALRPVIERLDAAEEELKKRRGGRPKGSKTKRKSTPIKKVTGNAS